MGTNGERAPLELQIVVGSTRPGRQAERLLPWVVDRAGRHGRFDVRLLDLRDWDLPMFQEPTELMLEGRFTTPTVERWNETIAHGDAYLFVFPEYNHSVPGVLKNAFDYALGARLRNKPAGFVSYSNGPIAGARAVEHMVGIVVEREMAPLRNAVLLGGISRTFDGDGLPVDPMTEQALSILLDDLAWWGGALRAARAAGQLPPPRQRPMCASPGPLLNGRPEEAPTRSA